MAFTVVVRFIVQGKDLLSPNTPATPLENVKCTIKAKQITNAYTDTKYTNSYGVADFDNVTYNNIGYTATFSKEGYTSSSFEFSVAQLNSFNITLYKSNYVTANVKVKNLVTAVNLSGVTITATYGTDAPIIKITDVSGGATFALRQSKTYVFKFSKPGFHNFSSNVVTTTTSASPTTFLMAPN